MIYYDRCLIGIIWDYCGYDVIVSIKGLREVVGIGINCNYLVIFVCEN